MSNNRAFSLVELSIVLVILGLLTGGILAGQSLIRAAELRAITTEFSRYQTAGQSFRDKYFAIPGDFTKAESFWGTAASCPGSYSTATTTPATCNGNGNGLLENGGGGPESLQFWKQLANAGLIEGAYTGVCSDAAGYNFGVVAPINVPMSRTGAEWTVRGDNSIVDITSTNYFEGNYGNLLQLDYMTSPITSETFEPLKPEEAWNIDTKMDDGKPGTGKVLTQEVDGAPCNTVAASNAVALATTAAYNLTQATKECSLVFPQAF